MLRERAPASISVSLILTHGRSNRLFVVRQGPESAHPGSYGLIAGGAELKDVSLLHAAFREALEEASISHNHIIFVRGRNDPKPHIAPIITQNSIRLGVVFDATYSGPKLPL